MQGLFVAEGRVEMADFVLSFCRIRQGTGDFGADKFGVALPHPMNGHRDGRDFHL